MTPEQRKEKAVQHAKTEIRLRRGRNLTLSEEMPKLRASVERAESYLRNAKMRLEGTNLSMDYNNDAIDELESGIAVLESSDGAGKDVTELEGDALDKISRYTGTNSITSVRYGGF